MNAIALPPWLQKLGDRTIAAPLIIVLLLSMMILPLPAVMLDVFFSFNIFL